MTNRLDRAPHPTHRLIPSRFPPIAAFDTVADAADASAVMALEGWTNDRLIAERLGRLAERDWVFGRANASVVMAAFLHTAPDGLRFSAGTLGAWYSAASLVTAAAEVAHHLKREAVARGVAEGRRTYRAYAARLEGQYLNLRGEGALHPDLYAPDRYTMSQPFGEAVRASGGDGILYDSVRHAGGVNVVAYRPRNVLDVVQGAHYEVIAPIVGRVIVRTLVAR
jgi:hypothetical protein